MNVFWSATVAILLAWAPYISSLSPPSEYLMFACPFSYPHITILESMKLLYKTTKEKDGENKDHFFWQVYTCVKPNLQSNGKSTTQSWAGSLWAIPPPKQVESGHLMSGKKAHKWCQMRVREKKRINGVKCVFAKKSA